MLEYYLVSGKERWFDLCMALVLILLACLFVWLVPQSSGSWRVALTLPALLLAPGYLLTVALFPRQTDLSGVNRAALSLGYSLVTVPLVALLVSLLGVRITPERVATGLLTLSVLVGLAGFIRRGMVSRVGTGGTAFQPRAATPGVKSSAALFGLSLAVVVGLGGLIGYLRTRVPLTEFYMLNSQGELDHYPTRQTDPVKVVLAVRNLEGRDITYRVQPSACTGSGKHLVPAGQEWRVNWSCPTEKLNDLRQVHFSLYREEDPQPYRSLLLKLR